MEDKNLKQRLNRESPVCFADRLGLVYADSVTQAHKKDNGQFFTPLEIASLMASLSEFNGKNIKILDPGCGSAVLSCALVEHLIQSNKSLQCIELVAYETDPKLLHVCKQSLDNLVDWARDFGILVKIDIRPEDFILDNADCLQENTSLFAKPREEFDLVISNPPYFKIPINDIRAIAAKIVVNGHPNIYAIFMALAATLLKENGELISITPRSFAAGSYFRVFREYFFGLIDLEKVHLFVSRRDTFGRDKVLQETVIIKGTKRIHTNNGSQVVITSSSGIKDLKSSVIKSFPSKEIIDLQSNEKILYLPTNDTEEAVLDVFRGWTGKLSDYNIRISTGPVVAFRAWDYIRESPDCFDNPCAPLFWLHNVKQMTLHWPETKPSKGQYLLIDHETVSLLIPNKNYVLLRRFSSKDDKSRLIAAPYFCNQIKSDYIGVENKVNYIYRSEGHLDRTEIIGLCALLNSNLFDAYFRIFNGNVNVSATELREMQFPPLETIREIGNKIILSNDFSVERANLVVGEYYEPVLCT